MLIFYFVYYVIDLDVVCVFYGGFLGCVEGCSMDIWVDFDFFGY